MAKDSSKLSLSDRFIVAAWSSGYFSDDNGNIYDKDNNRVPVSRTKSGHKRFTCYVSGVNERGWATVLVHRFIAFGKFGTELFNHPLVRHINSDPSDNSPDNLALGTYKDNRADIPKEVLSKNGKKNAHKLVARSRKLTDEQIRDIRNLRKEGNTFADIANKYGVAVMTVHRAVKNKSWKDVV